MMALAAALAFLGVHGRGFGPGAWFVALEVACCKGGVGEGVAAGACRRALQSVHPAGPSAGSSDTPSFRRAKTAGASISGAVP